MLRSKQSLSRRNFLRLSASTVGVGLLASCAPADSTGAPTASEAGGVAPEATTITYWDWWGPAGSAANKRLFDRLPEAMKESQPHLELDYQNVPFGDYFVKFLAAHAADDTPDVMHSSVYWARDFYDKGAITDLNPFVDVTPDLVQDTFIEGALGQATKGPIQYGIPGEGPDSRLIFYNIDMFEEAGVTTDADEIATWDWPDFTEAAKALTRIEDDEVVQSGFLVGTPSAATLSVWASCHDGHFYSKNADGTENGVGFNENDAAINGLHWFLDLLHESRVSQPIGPEQQDWNQFMQGTTAMAESGPWSFGRLNADMPDLNWSVMLWPAAPSEGGHRGTAVWNNMLVMPSKSANPEAGWDFLIFWCGLDWMIERLELGDWLSPRKDFYETAEYLKRFEELPELAMVPVASSIGTQLVYIQQNALNNEIRPVLEAVILQEEEPEVAVPALVETCNEIMAKAGYA